MPLKLILTGVIDDSDVGVVRNILNKTTTLEHTASLFWRQPPLMVLEGSSRFQFGSVLLPMVDYIVFASYINMLFVFFSLKPYRTDKELFLYYMNL